MIEPLRAETMCHEMSEMVTVWREVSKLFKPTLVEINYCVGQAKRGNPCPCQGPLTICVLVLLGFAYGFELRKYITTDAGL